MYINNIIKIYFCCLQEVSIYSLSEFSPFLQRQISSIQFPLNITESPPVINSTESPRNIYSIDECNTLYVYSIEYSIKYPLYLLATVCLVC